VVSFPHVSTPKPCIYPSSPQYVVHATPISFFSVWSHEQYWVSSTPSNDICKKNWVVGGGLFQLRTQVCFCARQSFGESFFYSSPFPKFSHCNSNHCLDLSTSYSNAFGISCILFYNVVYLQVRVHFYYGELLICGPLQTVCIVHFAYIYNIYLTNAQYI